MRYCMECGEKLTDDQRFCPICGTKVPEMIEPEQVQPAFAPAVEEKPKKSKLGLIIGICAGVLAIAAVFLVLILTGVLKLNRSKGEVIMEPSKEKLVELEDRSLTKIRETSESYAAEIRDQSFDAEVTLEVQPDPYAGSFDISSVLNNAGLLFKSDNTEGRNLGLTLTLWNNPIFELRFFDLQQKTLSFYCSTTSDKLYVASLDTMLSNLMGPQTGGVSVDSLLDFVFSDQMNDKIISDYEEIKQALFDTILEGEVDIQTDVNVNLFNEQEPTVCEVYTVRPTQEQIEKFLNRVFDIVENGDGYLSQIPALYGVSEQELKNAREEIPEIAEDVYDSELTFTVAIVGNDIVRQKISADEVEIVLDTRTTETGKNVMITAYEDGRNVSELMFTEDPDGKCTVNANIYPDVVITGSFDKNSKSLIGTFAGEFTVFLDGETVATIVIEPSETGMMHTITLDAEELDLDLDGDMKIHIDVRPGTGVQRPSGATTVDISEYSAEELRDLLYELVAPLSMLLSLQ